MVTRLNLSPMTNDANSIFTDAQGRALRGYDAVSYHRDDAAVEGDPDITWEWSGAIWAFATAANRDLFQAEPGRYAPAFGGHCAVGKALGFDLPGSPKRWRIEDGQLYVNKNAFAATQFRPLARRIRRLAKGASQ